MKGFIITQGYFSKSKHHDWNSHSLTTMRQASTLALSKKNSITDYFNRVLRAPSYILQSSSLSSYHAPY